VRPFQVAPSHDAAALGPAFRCEVDHAVRCGDDVQVVFDHHDRVPAIDQALKGGDEPCHVGHVEPGRGLIENVERMAQVR